MKNVLGVGGENLHYPDGTQISEWSATDMSSAENSKKKNRQAIDISERFGQELPPRKKYLYILLIKKKEKINAKPYQDEVLTSIVASEKK